jgi:hypothetical protein
MCDALTLLFWLRTHAYFKFQHCSSGAVIAADVIRSSGMVVVVADEVDDQER